MEEILIRAGSFVAIIILGFVLRKIGFFGDNAFEVLSKIVVKITLPAAIIKNFATSQMDVSMLSIALLGFIGGGLYVLVGYLTHLKKSKSEQAFAMLNLQGYNIGIFALPFVSGFLGPSGVVAACMMDVGNSFVCLGGAYGLASCVKDGKGFNVKRIGKVLITSVPFMCYLIMLLVALLKLPVPQPIVTCADIIASGNAFCAMLMIGVGFKLGSDKAQILYVGKMVGLRFGLGLLVAAAFYFLLPFEAEVRQTMALLAVSPISSAVPGLTRELGEDTGLSSTIGSISIVVSIVLMVAMLSLMLG